MTLSLIAACVAAGSSTLCIAQPEEAVQNSPEREQLEHLRKQRAEFQAQQLDVAPHGSWIFQPEQTPRIVWRDGEGVRSRGGDIPLRVRWFNADLQERAAPDGPGRWGAWIEGIAPNGHPFRRALTLFAIPRELPDWPAPQVTVTFPRFPTPTSEQIWREHSHEIDSHFQDALVRAILESETGAILIAGLTECQPLGRPARSLDSMSVRNADYHLALKLRLLGLQDAVRPLKPPRHRDVPALALHDGSMAEAGMHADAKSRVDALCRDWVNETGEPFVTLIARRGVIVTHEAFGTGPEGHPIDRDYRCWVGSITKTVTALLFSQFVDQGLIDLDDSIANVFPDYPRDDPHVPTFRQCLNHTSGLSGHGDFGGVTNPHLENIVLNGIDVNEPGVRYAYSGMGFELAAKGMEMFSGKCAARLYDEHLFRPLNFGDVPMGNASSDGEFTALELGILAQWVANRGSYGNLEFISARTFDRLLPEPLQVANSDTVHEEGIGLHWERRLKEGAPTGSTAPDDLLFSPQTVRHGSFSGCLFVIDLDQQIVIAQARRRSHPADGVWSARLFQTIADAVVADAPAPR